MSVEDNIKGYEVRVTSLASTMGALMDLESTIDMAFATKDATIIETNRKAIELFVRLILDARKRWDKNYDDAKSSVKDRVLVAGVERFVDNTNPRGRKASSERPKTAAEKLNELLVSATAKPEVSAE